jgi:hypothetical protein
MGQQNINIGAANAKAGDTLHSAFTKTQANFDELYESTTLDQLKVIYIAKAGNDSNSGLNINSPKLTIGAAILDAIALSPIETNQIAISVLDTGTYTETVNLPEWVHIDAQNAALNGRLTVSDSTITRFRRLQNTNIDATVVRKLVGTGFARITCVLMVVENSGQDGLLVNSGLAHLDVGVLAVDAGIGIKAKNGSRVSFDVKELLLSGGGLGIGTRTSDGSPNSFSGNILYALDEDNTGTLLEARVAGDVINIQAGSLIANTLYDMGAGTTLNAFANVATGARVADATATINSTVSGNNLTGGFIVYNDLATTGTPINHIGGATTILTNDELGPQTLKTYAPIGVDDIWDASGNTFDFTQLSNGDTVEIRLNVNVTTTSLNQEIEIDLVLGVGAFDYEVPYAHSFYKSIGTKREGGFEGIYMGDDNTRLNDAHFVFKSDDDATITVNGWYCKITRRG